MASQDGCQIACEWYGWSSGRTLNRRKDIAVTIWTIIYRSAWMLLALLLILTGIFMAIPKLRGYQNLQGQKEVLEVERQQSEEKLRELQFNQEQFRTDDQFLIDTAREAGMVRSNEVVYKFTNVPSNVRNP